MLMSFPKSLASIVFSVIPLLFINCPSYFPIFFEIIVPSLVSFFIMTFWSFDMISHFSVFIVSPILSNSALRLL